MKRLLILLPALLLALTACCAADASDGSPSVRNVIIMISDGCGYYHVDATSIYQHGKTNTQTYEKFPVRCAMSTYASGSGYDPDAAWAEFDYVKNNATDSAAAATAMSTGVKTYSGAIGMNTAKKPSEHIFERAESKGRSTGVVTSVEWSHATPAGFVAHNESRNNYDQIAREMVYKSAADVIMGCGHPFFDANGKASDKPITFKYVGGESCWNDLVSGKAAGDADGDGDPDAWTLIQTRDQFQALANKTGTTPTRVLGTPQVEKTLQQGRSGDAGAAPYAVPLIDTVPTLAEMSVGALNVLNQNPNGFCLMIEGGAVDWASHGNQSGRVIEEEIDFSHAVDAITQWVAENSSWEDTVLVVTGDHECGYLTGPDSDAKWNPIVNNGAGSQPGMEWHSGGHTNSLIPFYAKGTAAQVFTSLADQTDPVRGNYLDNIELAEAVFKLLD